MASERVANFRVVDKRSSARSGDSGERPIPPGWRRHSVLLGHYSEDQALDFLRGIGIHEDWVADSLRDRERAMARLEGLPPLDHESAAFPLEHPEAIAEITRVMSRPECKAAFPEGSWNAELVDVSKLIPLKPGTIDLGYAENLRSPGAGSKDLMSAVRLCFAEKRPAPFEVSLDQQQKSISLVGIHPSYEVIGLRCGQQAEDGPLIVSFMVSPPPNIVVALRHAERYFLFDGYHRVYQLMKTGFSHVPCLVRQVSSLTQLCLSGPGFFTGQTLTCPRPPLFQDFSDALLGTVIPLPAMRRVIRIRPDEYSILA